MNCKPGDLAFCVRVFDPRLAENIGRIVTVESLSDYSEEDGLPFWNVVAHDPGVLGFNGRGFFRVTRCVIRDCNLRPISGVPLDDETPIETNVPEALKLALGIEAPVLS